MAVLSGLLLLLAPLVGLTGIILFIVRKSKKADRLSNVFRGRYFFAGGFLMFFVGLIGLVAFTDSSELAGSFEEGLDAAETEVENSSEDVTAVEELSNDDLSTENVIESEDTSSKAEIEEENDSLPYAIMFEDHASYASDNQIEMHDKSIDFINENEVLFSEDASAEEIFSDADEVDTRELTKSLSNHYGNHYQINGTVIEIEEEEMPSAILTYIHILDENFNSITAILYKEAEGVFENDDITLTGTPLGAYSFENVSGGHTNAIFFAATHAEHYEVEIE
ncbi:hypothetical protein [Geomicrobium sediminis]|uniref:DUF4190 domain-containing protein n=1 Tax=Geomicrobium sediminis TaxID=1347788 RepID=A0ABS2PEL5_9BACL|nr:hypothetical protein [Geomicrobium sediminis]MBM7633875.1 hypothetical protein [Geomicrobium sediminis]